MQISKAKEELPIPAYERRSADVASELREILGMSHLWVVDADGKRLEPKQEDPTSFALDGLYAGDHLLVRPSPARPIAPP